MVGCRGPTHETEQSFRAKNVPKWNVATRQPGHDFEFKFSLCINNAVRFCSKELILAGQFLIIS